MEFLVETIRAGGLGILFLGLTLIQVWGVHRIFTVLCKEGLMPRYKVIGIGSLAIATMIVLALGAMVTGVLATINLLFAFQIPIAVALLLGGFSLVYKLARFLLAGQLCTWLKEPVRM